MAEKQKKSLKEIMKFEDDIGRVIIENLQIEQPIIYKYFKSLPADKRIERLKDALFIGVIALKEERLQAFFTRTRDRLSSELNELKTLFEMEQNYFMRTSVKGMSVEEELTNMLNDYFKREKLKDEAVQTGGMAGEIEKNKTGDILIYVDGDKNKKIVIECKFDKERPLETTDILKKSDSAFSQLLEGKANRNARVSIIIFDVSLSSSTVRSFTKGLRYIPNVGFVAVIDYLGGDFSNLFNAYLIARDIVNLAKDVKYDPNLLQFLINGIVKDLEAISKIEDKVKSNIKANKEILEQIARSKLLIKFRQKYLQKFLEDGTLTNKDLMEFYMGNEEMRDEFKLVSKEIKQIVETMNA